MSGILVIESDRKRRSLLRALLREHAQLEITIVDSVEAAIAGFEKYEPDVIVTPTLLPREDSDRLCSYVKRYADPHVQMLSLPALDLLREPQVEERHGFGFFRRRRPAGPGLQYDPALVGGQIAESVERARQMRSQLPVDRDRRLLLRPDEANDFRPTRPPQSVAPVRERRMDQRMPQRSPSPWIVQLPGGADVELVNISRRGILLESRSLVSPGVTLELHVSSAGVNRIVPARFIRSEVARVDSLGVRHYSAALFERPFEIPGPSAARLPRAAPQSLADLFASVVADSSQLEPRATRFAKGLRGLVGARDVMVAQSPRTSADDSESIYFTVKGDGASRTILQVVFDRHRALTAADFALLKAAVAMTTAVLELEPAYVQELRSAEVA